MKSNNFYNGSKGVNFLLLGILFSGIILMNACAPFELPEAGSKPDETPPTAGFSYKSEAGDDLTIRFSNASTSATSYSWDFGDGNTSTEKEPMNTYAAYGTYSVKLVSTDGLGVASEVTQEVKVEEGPYQPVIMEAGFEDGQLEGGLGDGRDSWRNSDLGGVIQITGDPVRTDLQGAKLPGGGDKRIGYQEIVVEADTDYEINFYYTMVANGSGFLKVAVLGDVPADGFTDHATAEAATINAVTVNDQSEPDTYLGASVRFNSGTNEKIAIYFYNDGTVESRLDDFTINITSGGVVPPSASFTYEQSEMDYLEYAFTNASVNATSYSWDFGDGNTSDEESPTHVYTDADMYTVTLTASSELGGSNEFTALIDIQAPVTADFTYMADAGNYKMLTFMNASEGDESVMWDFGDGYQSDLENPTHVYIDDGIYEVSLTATSITGLESNKKQTITVAAGFIVQVLNGTFDDHTASTSDNADSWDMTPNSTILAEDGSTIDSPYRALWYNSDLANWLETNTGDSNEQPGSTSDGTYQDGVKTRGGKFSSTGRRLYQKVEVQSGVEYTFSIDTRSESMGVNTEVFILNTEITDEVGINASTSDPAIDGYIDITNDHNPSKGDASTNTFTKTTFDFTASGNFIVIYVRSPLAVDSSNEVFIDNVEVTEK